MFDFGIGGTELMVIAVVALLIVGPKDLPRLLRTIGRIVTKIRAIAREFQGHLDEAMRETGLDEIKDNVTKMKEFSVSGLDEDFSRLEEEYRRTAMPAEDAAPDTSWAGTDDAPQEGGEIPSLDGEPPAAPAEEKKTPGGPTRKTSAGKKPARKSTGKKSTGKKPAGKTPARRKPARKTAAAKAGRRAAAGNDAKKGGSA